MTDMDPKVSPIIICEPRKDCADQNIHRWHCMRGHDSAPGGVCPLEYCDLKGTCSCESEAHGVTGVSDKRIEDPGCPVHAVEALERLETS